MKAILNIRSKIAQYQEIYYLIFVLIMGGLASAGLTSQHKIYQVMFALAALFWLVKMAVTDFRVSEILIMAAVFVLLGFNLLGNGEKTLLISAMAIFGAKNVDLNKVFKYGFFTKLIMTIGVFAGVFAGIIENVEISLPKNGERYAFYCYGYIHPNAVFANCLTIFIIAMAAFKDRVKWYMYVLVSLLIAVTYKYIMCRTGIVVWAVLCLMVIIYKLTKDKKMGDIYRRILVVAPVAICIFTFVLNILCRNNEELNTKMEKLLTGRVLHMNSFMDNVGFNMLGIVPAESFDSMYFHLLYNYGWVLFIAVILAYTIAMWYCYKEKLHYELIAMAAMSVYGFMEFMPLSVVWNFTIICLSYVVFRRKNKADERLQQKVSDY
jgi:hypothetical protein